MITTRLYGATNVQIYLYLKNYREDQAMIKCAVAFLWYVKSRDVEPALESATG